MGYLIDVDGFNVGPSFKGYGKRLFLDSNGVLYFVFRNLNDEVELKRSYDGGQSWQHLASASLLNVDESKKDLLYVGKKSDGIFVAFDFRVVDYKPYCSVLKEDASFFESYIISGSGYGIVDSTGILLDNELICVGTAYNSAYSFGVYGEDTSSGDLTEYGNVKEYRRVHDYDEDAVLLSYRIDGYEDDFHLILYFRNINSHQDLILMDGTDFEFVQSYFKLVKVDYTKTFFIANVKDPTDGIRKVNLYKWDYDNASISLVDTVISASDTETNPIVVGNYDIAKDGYGNLYILYVKQEPNDYLFMRKFNRDTQTLEAEQQLTDFKVRVPQIVSALPNSRKVYYTYQRADG